jgi:hypothetical protein
MPDNNTFVILIDMAEKQHRGGIKGGIATDDNNKAKAIAAIPMAGAIVTAALLLSGLSLIGSYQQPVIAQQNMTGGGGGGGDGGITTTTDNATTTTTTTMSGAAQGGNATNATSAGGGGNQSTSEVRMNIEQAHMALQNNDTQSALMYLDMALSALGGDGAEEDSECGGVTVGGTSAADDYGCPPDPDY